MGSNGEEEGGSVWLGTAELCRSWPGKLQCRQRVKGGDAGRGKARWFWSVLGETPRVEQLLGGDSGDYGLFGDAQWRSTNRAGVGLGMVRRRIGQQG
jgi:hypothetical protein